MVSKLDPINFEDVKTYINSYDNNYKDQGTKGFAQFLCDYPFKDKFVTSDYSRNTIVYKTNNMEFIRDPESSYLLNRSIKENSDAIIEKAENRLDFINRKIKKADGEDEMDEYVIKKSELKKLINVAENISSSKINDKDVSNVFRDSGLNTYQRIIEVDENNRQIEG